MDIRTRILSTLLLLLATLSVSLADTGVIRLTSYPSITVADGRSTTTVSAEIRDRNGRLVPDGTQVVFSTNLGSFNDPIAKTTSGTARAVFSAGSVPGTAKIQASAYSFNAVSTLDLELVADRSMLSNMKEYIEVVADGYMMYSMDQRIIGAAAPNRGVSIRYRGVTIEADDAQVNVTGYEVRARKAKLKFGKIEAEFDELYFRLNHETGYGVTTVEVPSFEMHGQGSSFRFVKSTRSRYGIAEISRQGIVPPKTATPYGIFEFADLLDSTSTVSAKKALAFPKGQIQFHRAELFVGTNRVMKMPLFQVNMFSSSPLVTDQVLNVYDSQLSVNYPHYLSLKPGETSVLRLRTGERYGRNTTSLGGLFLDYEMNWNRGDDMEGGLTVTGITRKDWSIGARQHIRFDSRTVASAQLEFPAHKSMYGSANLNRQFDGFQVALNASQSRTLRGPKFESSQYTAVMEKDPTKVGNLPLRLFYGLTANYNSSSTETTTLTQNTVGARVRAQLLPVRLDPQTNLSGSLLFTRQVGTGVLSEFATFADLSLSRNFGAGASIYVTYNYADDGFTSRLTGKNSFSLSGFLEKGRTSFSIQANRSLDVDRQSYFVDSSYRISDLWRLSYQLTFDQYLGERYLEDIAMLSYRFGIREIGVTYSIREKRLGFQIFGAQFN